MRTRSVNIILGGAVLVLSPLAAAAQQIAVGAKTGLTSANQESEGVDNDGVTGNTAGLFITIPIGRYFSVQPEVLLLGKGSEIEDELLTETVEYEQSFVEVPLLLKVGFPTRGHSVRPHVYVGPSIGFELSCEGSMEQAGMDETNDTDPNCGDASLGASALPTKSTEFSVLFGAGFDFDVGPIFVGLEGRYSLGLSDIRDAAPAGASSIKNRVIAGMLSVGIRLP